MTASPRQSQLLRTLLAACLIVTLLSVASAQSVSALLATQVEAITATVIGRAPVVTVAVENLTRPGEDALVGNALRATATATDPDDDTITATSYRWLRGDTEIASTNTYTVVEADRGETLTVEAIATTDSAITDPASGTGNTDVAVTANHQPTATPTITGALQVGVQLTGNPGYADAENDPPGAHVYRWYRSDTAAGEPRTPIDGATSATYTLIAADLDKYLVFGVVPMSTVAPTTGVESFAVASAKVVTGTAPTIANLSISGAWMAGGVITASFDLVDADDDQIDEAGMVYSWYVGDSPDGGNPVVVPGATGRSFTLREQDVGSNRRVWFRVDKAKTLTGVPNERLRPTDPPDQWQVMRQGPIVMTSDVPTAQPAIKGDLTIGSTLIGHVNYTGPLDDPEGVHTYRWLRSDDAAGLVNKTPLEGATGTTLALTEALRGKYLTFEVTPRTVSGVEGATAVAVTPLPVEHGQRYTMEGGYCAYDKNAGGLECTRTFTVSGRSAGTFPMRIGVSYNPQTSHMPCTIVDTIAPNSSVVMSWSAFKDGPGLQGNFQHSNAYVASPNGTWTLRFRLTPGCSGSNAAMTIEELWMEF